MLAEAVLPLPPSFEVTAPVTLFCIPELIPETFTEKLHEALSASVAPERLTLADPAVAVIVPPPQLPVRPLGVDTVRPAGIASAKPTPLSDALVLGFDSVKVKVVVPFNGMLAAPNAFAMVGGEVWGGGGAPDEPPPQPEACARPTATIIQHEMRCSFRGTLFAAPRE